MLGFLKPTVEKVLQPAAFVLRKVNPNVITMSGLVIPVLFFAAVVHKMYLLALVIFIFNVVDMLDGMVARSQHKVTAFGFFLDATVDRFADFTLLVAFGFAGIVSWRIVLPLVLLTYLISYIRTRTELAAKDKLVANVGIVERTERLITIFAGLVLYAALPYVRFAGQNIMSLVFVVLIVLSAVTVAQRVAFAYKHL